MGIGERDSIIYRMNKDNPPIENISFKTLFVKHQDLLKKLVAELLRIRFESIGQFEVADTEVPPEILGDKFCRLGIK